jgi:cell division protein FtsQ
MATEPEDYRAELLPEDEPRYVRGQEPVKIHGRRFGRRTWQLYRRVLVGGTSAVVCGWLFYQAGLFFLHSPRVVLADLQQIELIGNHYVDRATVLEKFAADAGRSILRVPLAERRKALEEIPWVEQASVERLLPKRLRVEIVERTPVAFLRLGSELALVDAYGVILKRPLDGQFHFPVVVGIGEAMALESRQQRMRLYLQFMKEIELARAGAAEDVSEVDLSDDKDLRAVLAGIAAPGAPAAGDQGDVLVHFGDGDYGNKFHLFVEGIGQWRLSAGRVESVDLRFARQVILNPEGKRTAAGAPRRFEATGMPR